MRSAFDLWSYDDVKTHAAAILAQLDAGTMPCDGAWPAGRVRVVRRWIDSGMPRWTKPAGANPSIDQERT
jgi:hypothetical protein